MDGLEVFHDVFEQDIFFGIVNVALENAARQVAHVAADIIVAKGEDTIREIVKKGFLIDFENRAFSFEELRHYFVSRLPLIKDLLQEQSQMGFSGHYALSVYVKAVNMAVSLGSYFTGAPVVDGIDMCYSRMDQLIFDVDSSFNIVTNALSDKVSVDTHPYFFALFVETFHSEMGRLQQLQHTQEIANADIPSRMLNEILQKSGGSKSLGNITRDEFTDYVVLASMPNNQPTDEDLPYEPAFQESSRFLVDGRAVETTVQNLNFCGVDVSVFQMQNRSNEDAIATHFHSSFDSNMFDDVEVAYALQYSVRITVQQALDLKKRMNSERTGKRVVMGGTTMLHCVLMAGGKLAVANVGDSMAYIVYELGGVRHVEGLTAVADLQSYMMFQIVTDGKGSFLRKDAHGCIRYKHLDMNREIGHLEPEYSEPFFATRDLSQLRREGASAVKIVLKSDCAHIFTDKGQLGSSASQIGRRIFYASKMCCGGDRSQVDDISVITFDLDLEAACGMDSSQSASFLICDGHGIGGDNDFSEKVAHIQIKNFEEKMVNMFREKLGERNESEN